jgi:two-component system sensor histidine kinase FlrB
VAPEAEARLFEPFFTTKSDGLGMGLAIARAIAEAHGGRLVVEPANGQGACFSLTLPLAEDGDR